MGPRVHARARDYLAYVCTSSAEDLLLSPAPFDGSSRFGLNRALGVTVRFGNILTARATLTLASRDRWTRAATRNMSIYRALSITPARRRHDERPNEIRVEACVSACKTRLIRSLALYSTATFVEILRDTP